MSRGPVRVSARNQIPGRIVTIVFGTIMAEVVIDIGGGNQMVSIISVAAARELQLQENVSVVAIIKSTEVLIGLPAGVVPPKP